MAWTPDPIELAWAAGFFDGEGSTYADPRPRLCVVQNDPEVLERFDRAIGRLGRLYGGKRVYGRAKKPMYVLKVTGWRDVQTVVAMLWPNLSTAKREQASRVLAENLEKMLENPRYGDNRRRTPLCGSRVVGHRVASCRECHRYYERRYEASGKRPIRGGG